MKKLNIVNPNASDLGDAFGFSLERKNFLAGKLDEMISVAKTGELRIVYLQDVLLYIQEYCLNEEELLWAAANHIAWLAKTGRLLTQ